VKAQRSIKIIHPLEHLKKPNENILNTVINSL